MAWMGVPAALNNRLWARLRARNAVSSFMVFSKSARCSSLKGCTYLMIITSSGRGEYATQSGLTLYQHCVKKLLVGYLVLGEYLFVGSEFGWSATAWLIMQTLGAMVFPFRDPGRHSHAMHLIGLGNGLDGCACGTQQQTVGAAPRAECRILFHGLF